MNTETKKEWCTILNGGDGNSIIEHGTKDLALEYIQLQMGNIMERAHGCFYDQWGRSMELLQLNDDQIQEILDNDILATIQRATDIDQYPHDKYDRIDLWNAQQQAKKTAAKTIAILSQDPDIYDFLADQLDIDLIEIQLPQDIIEKIEARIMKLYGDIDMREAAGEDEECASNILDHDTIASLSATQSLIKITFNLIKGQRI